MLTVYLVRHGQKHHSKNDPSITELGIAQAKKTAEYFRHIPLSKIVVSPSKRTQQTAWHIASAVNVRYQTDDRLIERMDFANWPHEDFKDFLASWLKASHEPEFQPVSGVSSLKKSQLMTEVINEFEGNETVLLVTHGGAIGDFLRTILPADQQKELWKEFEYGEDYNVPECSITKIEKDLDKWKVITLCSVNHLE